MEAADLRGSGVKVVVLMDGIGTYYAGAGAFSNTRLYEVMYDAAGSATTTGIVSRRLSSTELGLTATGSEELNMGDVSNLSKFIAFVQANYAADDYSMVMWDHGDGWRADASKPAGAKAICWDDSSGTSHITTKQLGDAVSGKGLSLIGFDACLMGMAEVGYELRADAAVMVGSQDNEPGPGWLYNVVLDNIRADAVRTPATVGNDIVQAYKTAYPYTAVTLSAIDLTKMAALRTAIDGFKTGLDATPFATVFSAVTGSSLQRFKGDGTTILSHVDLYDLASRLSTVAGATALMAAVTDAVIAEYHYGTSFTYAHGIAIYLPLYGFALLSPNEYTAANLDFCADSTWDEYLYSFWRGSDAYEANDGFGTAVAITKSVNYAGYIQYPLYTYGGSSAFDVDIFKIEVTGNGTFTINLGLTGTAVDGKIMLFHSSSTSTAVASKDAGYAGTSETLTYDTANATTGKGVGTYYIVILPYTGSATYDRANPYTLRVTAGTATIQ